MHDVTAADASQTLDASLAELSLRLGEMTRERDVALRARDVAASDLQAALHERDEYKARSEFLKRELDRLADAQKTPREHVDLSQVQLAFAEWEALLLKNQPAASPGDTGDTEQPATPAPPGGKGGREKGKPRGRSRHGRNVLPEDLFVRTIVITPKNLPAEHIIIGEEVSWRLGVLPTRFFRLKVVRPLIVVPKDEAPDADLVAVAFHEGDVSSLSGISAAAAKSASEESTVAVELELCTTMGATTEAAPPEAVGADMPGNVPPLPVAATGVIGAETACDEGYAAQLPPAAPALAVKSDDDSGVAGRTADQQLAATPVAATNVAPAGAGAVPTGDDGAVAVDAHRELLEPLSLAKTTVVCATMPHEMIPRGLPTPDVLALVLTAKFADKSPFNRQEGIYVRSGVHITRGTMCGWARECHKSAHLVVDAMCEEAKSSAHFIATDATGVLVQANERCRRGHFWVFVADRDHVFFRYSPKHSSEEPKRFFVGFRGTVVADASNVFDALFAPQEELYEGQLPAHRAGCNAHARRYYYKALGNDRDRALVGIGFYNRLFELERDFADLPPAKRLVARQEWSAPVADCLREWRDAELAAPSVTPGTPIHRALQYGKNHWDELTRFLHDGRIPIHNNWSELELRRMVIGRCNWLFVGSDESAEWTCTFVSLVASCQLHQLDPQRYLCDLFRVLPSWPRNRVLELAPKYWRATRERLDPAELALPMGPLTVPAALPVPLAPTAVTA